MSETKELTKREPQSIAMGKAGLVLTSLEDAFRFAQGVVKSGLAPKGDTAETVLMKLQAGAELGLPPMRALSALAVVNGRLSVMGEAALAICRASGKFSKIEIGCGGEGDKATATVQFIRSDTGETGVVAFSMADARRAGLAGKDTYKSFPEDMLIWKAVSRFAKRYASDVLMGIEPSESAETFRPVVHEEADRPQLPPPPETPDPIFETDAETGQPIEVQRTDAKDLFA